jgi:hypothetical protein
MEISKTTKGKIEELNKFSGSKIKNPDDLSLLLEISQKSEKEKLFSDLQFTAKYLNGLGKILHTNISAATNPKGNGKPVSAEEARAKVMDEFKANMKKLTEQIAEYIKDADEESKKEFEEKFLSLNQQSLQNLTTLIYDLSWMKMFVNTKRE